MNPRRVALVAIVALGLGAGLGGLLAGGGSNGRATQTGSQAIGLPEANLAVGAQQLQSALAAYAAVAGTIRTSSDARRRGVVLERSEEALAEVGESARRLAANERGREPSAAKRHLAVAQRVERVRARAIALREAAQAETDGSDAVLALGAFAGQVERTSARLRSLLTLLTAAADEPTYARTLAAIEREIADMEIAKVSA